MTPEQVSQIQALLREVWSDCKKSSIADDAEIIEYIAFLLTERSRSLDPKLQPQRPRNKYSADDEKIKDRLNEASKIAGGDAILFDRYVLFQYSQISKEGAYAIPRHLTDFALALLQINPEDTFADFTCGSGGFLVHRYTIGDSKITSPGQSTGVELSPQWVHIAYANTVLHRLQGLITIHQGNSFRVCGGSGPLANRTFDCIAAAPPFGLSIEPIVTRDTPGITIKGHSESLFTQLACEKLAPEGRAAIMVPTGLLYREADSTLREWLIKSEDYALQAVLSLGEGALYPFSSVATSLLLICKSRQKKQRHTWFFTLENDGYPHRRSRNLLEDPSRPNDLQIVEAALRLYGRGITPVPILEKGSVSIRKALLVEPLGTPGQFLGVAVQATDTSANLSLNLFQVKQQDKQDNYLLARVSFTNQQPVTIGLLLSAEGAGRPFIIESENRWKRDTYHTQDDEDIPFLVLSNKATISEQMSVISHDGRLLGITMPLSKVTGEQYNLQAEIFVPAREEQQPSISAASLLSRIQRDQYKISRLTENLLEQLETKPLVGKTIPPSIVQVHQDFDVLASLEPEQDTVWQHIMRETIDLSGQHALPFTLDQLLSHFQDPVKTQQVLDLLEGMGLIIQATVHQQGRTTRYYRRVTEQEIPDSPS